MKPYQKILLFFLGLLLAATASGLFLTSDFGHRTAPLAGRNPPKKPPGILVNHYVDALAHRGDAPCETSKCVYDYTLDNLVQIHRHAGPRFHRVNDYPGCWAQQSLPKDPRSRPNGVARPPITKRNNQCNLLSQHLRDRKALLHKKISLRISRTSHAPLTQH